jgi:hypothetical protein
VDCRGVTKVVKGVMGIMNLKKINLTMNRWQTNNGDNQMDDGGSKKDNKKYEVDNISNTHILWKFNFNKKMIRIVQWTTRALGRTMGWWVEWYIIGLKGTNGEHMFTSFCPCSHHHVIFLKLMKNISLSFK